MPDEVRNNSSYKPGYLFKPKLASRGGPASFQAGGISIQADTTSAYIAGGAFALLLGSISARILIDGVIALRNNPGVSTAAINETQDDPGHDLEMQPIPPPENHNELKRNLYEWPNIPPDTCALGVQSIDNGMLQDFVIEDFSNQIIEQIQGNDLGLASYEINIPASMSPDYSPKHWGRIVWTCTPGQVLD